MVRAGVVLMKKRNGSGWRGESRRHSLARKGVSTVIDDDRRFDVSNFVARGGGKVKYLGEGRSMHGYLDRSWDEYLFEEPDGEETSVIVFNEPDWDGIRDMAYDMGIEDDDDEAWNKLVEKEENEFYEKGGGEVHVICAGALDFMGTEEEFANEYPDLNQHLRLIDFSGTWIVKDFEHPLKYHAELMPQGHYKIIAEDKSGRYRLGYTIHPESLIKETFKGYDVEKVGD